GVGTAQVPAPLEQLPLFVRQGAILPLGPVMNYTDEFKSDHLDVHVWPGVSSEFTLFEDDGVSWKYKEGNYAKTIFSLNSSEAGTAFTVQAREGQFDTGRKSYTIIFHDIDRLSGVERNNEKMQPVAGMEELDGNAEGFFYDADARKLSVKFGDKGEQITLRLK
ncbi:MAG: DUF5110 domain-containing protein, partial [Candidatus Electrothrix sp. ATG1]|nr:DUF5110 domain-containing protein [Candidatus Electrothrix sp. ATG1]